MNRQTRLWIASLSLVLISGLVVAHVVSGQGGRAGVQPPILLSFHTMVGNNPDETINGIESDDLPWVITRADGLLTTDGQINLNIRGLVFANDPSVPPDLRGKNDEANFRAVLSCLTENQNGDLVVANVTTKPFAATTSGNSQIHDRITLPNPCLAPIVFVIGDEGEWLAVTGFSH